jgi:phosphate transport system permease protein
MTLAMAEQRVDTRREKVVRRFALTDMIFAGVSRAAAILVLLILGGVAISLIAGSWSALTTFGIGFLTTESWNPVTEKFGALAPIYGTIVTSGIAILIAVPIGIGIAVFLTELCPRPLRRPIGIAVELLAGIPSIIYGIWGLFIFAPFVQTTVQPFLIGLFHGVPGLSSLFAGPPYGIGMLTSAMILAIMVLPFITSITRDVFDTVPAVLKESAYGIGCTTWEVVRRIVIPYTRVGIMGGVMLGLGRALGETMAVTFVIGNAHRISASLLAPGTTISATIANEFTEADGELYTSSLISLGLILFVITLIILAAARYMPDMSTIYPRRKATNGVMMALCMVAAVIGLAWLALILGALIYNGLAGINIAVFTEMTPPPGQAGGLLNALAGSLVITVIAVFIGTPIGILAGTYMAEYGRFSKLTAVVRFINDILLSAPSIVVGLFVYELVVRPMGHFSAIAGAFALAVLVIPVVVRTTEDMLTLVPNALREAGTAIGAPRWIVIRSVAYRAALSGIVTGVLLAIARISGETAPLLFTALNNQFWSSNLNAPMASLPVTIFQFALSPYEEWQQLAWTGALIITLTVLALSIVARSLTGRREER